MDYTLTKLYWTWTAQSIHVNNLSNRIAHHRLQRLITFIDGMSTTDAFKGWCIASCLQAISRNFEVLADIFCVKQRFGWSEKISYDHTHSSGAKTNNWPSGVCNWRLSPLNGPKCVAVNVPSVTKCKCVYFFTHCWKPCILIPHAWTTSMRILSWTQLYL